MSQAGQTLLLLSALVVGPVACSTTDVPTESVSTQPLDVRTWIEGDPGRGIATLAVQITQDPELDVALTEPEARGLRFVEVESAERERLGSQVVLTRRFRFSGEPGSYEIPALQATTTVGEAPLAATSDPIWIDIGEAPPLPDDFVDIEDPEPVFRLSPTLIVAGVCVGLTGLGLLGSIGLGAWAFSGRKPRELPPEAPGVVALRRWSAVRADDTLDDYDKALALSTIFREYAEATLGFPAVAWTTSEILAHLDQLAHLPEGNVGRAKRILRATDRIKYADASARATLFEELDDALRTFISSTQPRVWDGDT